jgi:hypothetical protein
LQSEAKLLVAELMYLVVYTFLGIMQVHIHIAQVYFLTSAYCSCHCDNVHIRALSSTVATEPTGQQVGEGRAGAGEGARAVHAEGATLRGQGEEEDSELQGQWGKPQW